MFANFPGHANTLDVLPLCLTLLPVMLTASLAVAGWLEERRMAPPVVRHDETPSRRVDPRAA